MRTMDSLPVWRPSSDVYDERMQSSTSKNVPHIVPDAGLWKTHTVQSTLGWNGSIS